MGTIIAVASSKGGAGKTTTAASLIGWHAMRGATVAGLDADPNQHLLRWAQAAGAGMNNLTVAATNDAAIAAAARNAAASADYVVIDLPGVLGMAITKAAALADVLLIPTKTSDGDTAEAARTYVAAVDFRRAGGVTAALLVDASARNRLTNHSRQQLSADGVPVLTAMLTARECYPLSSVSGTFPSADKAAAADVAAVAAEIENLLAAAGGQGE